MIIKVSSVIQENINGKWVSFPEGKEETDHFDVSVFEADIFDPKILLDRKEDLEYFNFIKDRNIAKNKIRFVRHVVIETVIAGE